MMKTQRVKNEMITIHNAANQDHSITFYVVKSNSVSLGNFTSDPISAYSDECEEVANYRFSYFVKSSLRRKWLSRVFSFIFPLAIKVVIQTSRNRDEVFIAT